MEQYTLRGIQAMLGISRGVIAGLIAAGFVTPGRGKRREYLFTFQDVVLLRTAHGLQKAGIPPRRILRSLRELRARLPEELPLTGLRITAVGNEIAVRDGDTHWHPDTGQLLLDFELARAPGTAISLRQPAPGAEARAAPGGQAGGAGAGLPVPEQATAEESRDWFSRALALEAHDKKEAQAAYRRVIERAPQRVDAWLNLGVMLSDAGQDDEAVALYRDALGHHPDEALLYYNLAVALEDLQHEEEALESYERCLRLDPTFADAHYNAARLHEVLGHPKKAIRHYSAYRRLQR